MFQLPGCFQAEQTYPMWSQKYKMKEHRKQSPIPFFLQTSLSFSYLLHNLMSKELFGKALKCKNKKQESKKKKEIEQKKVEGKSLDIRDGGLKRDKKERRTQL